MDAGAMRRTLGRIAHEVLEANGGGENLVVAGIMKGGVPIAKRLAYLMSEIEGALVPCGNLDIKPNRDDNPVSTEDSEIPFQVAGKTVILVDEVVFTGRTVRAALDALLRYGRPDKVQLAVLVDRGHRELPIEPNFCGIKISTNKSDHVLVKTHEEDGEDSVTLTLGAS